MTLVGLLICMCLFMCVCVCAGGASFKLCIHIFYTYFHELNSCLVLPVLQHDGTLMSQDQAN